MGLGTRQARISARKLTDVWNKLLKSLGFSEFLFFENHVFCFWKLSFFEIGKVLEIQKNMPLYNSQGFNILYQIGVGNKSKYISKKVHVTFQT